MADAQEPLSLPEVKVNLRVDADSTVDDSLISGLIVAAREHVEDLTGLVLTPRTITETARSLGRWIDLAAWPVRAVTAIRYPVAGSLTDLAAGSWAMALQRRPARLLPGVHGWGVGCASTYIPTTPVEIDIEAGFADPADVPQAVKQAMHLLISHWYRNRSAAVVGSGAAAVPMPLGVDALLRRWRVTRV